MDKETWSDYISIYRREYDKKYAVEVFVYDPNIEELIPQEGTPPEYYSKRWITVGVFNHYIPAKKCAKSWRKRIGVSLNAAETNAGASQ